MQPLIQWSEGLSEVMYVVSIHMVGVLESRAHLPFSAFWEWWEVVLQSVGVYLVQMTQPSRVFSPSGPGLTPSLWSPTASG